ncbi:MAG: hypothetical protein Q9226_007369 [Calogaya cf. arnoldii]
MPSLARSLDEEEQNGSLDWAWESPEEIEVRPLKNPDSASYLANGGIITEDLIPRDVEEAPAQGGRLSREQQPQILVRRVQTRSLSRFLKRNFWGSPLAYARLYAPPDHDLAGVIAAAWQQAIEAICYQISQLWHLSGAESQM